MTKRISGDGATRTYAHDRHRRHWRLRLKHQTLLCEAIAAATRNDALEEIEHMSIYRTIEIDCQVGESQPSRCCGGPFVRLCYGAVEKLLWCLAAVVPRRLVQDTSVFDVLDCTTQLGIGAYWYSRKCQFPTSPPTCDWYEGVYVELGKVHSTVSSRVGCSSRDQHVSGSGFGVALETFELIIGKAT